MGHCMEELTLFLFLWIAMGPACPWLVSAAVALAVGAPWLCLGLLGWPSLAVRRSPPCWPTRSQRR